MASAASPSVTEAARWVPSGLTEDDMILPSLMTGRLPYGAMYWSLETTWPLVGGLADLLGAELAASGRQRCP